jgi:serine/threonine protein kinase
METEQLQTFRKSALASGLITAEELAAAEAAVAKSAPAHEPSFERLADQLVASGKLNRWQVQQLRLGRSKFNLGPYRILDSIGQGGMGQVFKAEHVVMGRIVAVKVLPRHRSTTEAISNFHREIRAQALLDHANLVRALDAGHDGNVHFLVTEYVPGIDLRKYIRRHGKLSPQDAAWVISQAARGLHHAHTKGLIHRDVKPGNVLLTKEGQVKVSDLGLVSYFDESGMLEANQAKIVGTADYVAPEQVHSPDKVSPASDVYALGCTFYYAVTGKVPFPGGTTRDKLKAHCEYQPLDPRRLNPELPPEVVDIMADMMAKTAAERIASAGIVADRLAPWAIGSTLANRTEAVSTTSSFRDSTPPPGWLAPPDDDAQDTQPPFVIHPDPGYDESPSQISQSTHPISAAGEETIPALIEPDEPIARWIVERRGFWTRVAPGVPLWLIGLMGLGALGVIGLVSAIILQSLS